jgi:hypothetical protein
VPGWVFLSITSRLTLSLPFHQWPILLYIYLPSVLYNCYSWQHCWIRQLRVTSVFTVILVCLRYYVTALYFMRKCKSSFSYFLSLCTFTKLEKGTITFVMSVCLSVCPSFSLHGTNGLALDGFSWNLIFGYLLKLYWENSRLIKIWQEWQVCYLSMYVYLW